MLCSISAICVLQSTRLKCGRPQKLPLITLRLLSLGNKHTSALSRRISSHASQVGRVGHYAQQCLSRWGAHSLAGIKFLCCDCKIIRSVVSQFRIHKSVSVFSHSINNYYITYTQRVNTNDISMATISGSVWVAKWRAHNWIYDCKWTAMIRGLLNSRQRDHSCDRYTYYCCCSNRIRTNQSCICMVANRMSKALFYI